MKPAEDQTAAPCGLAVTDPSLRGSQTRSNPSSLRGSKTRSNLLALFAASLWGISGACAQYLFQQKGISIDWLVSVRLLVAGALLLVLAALQGQAVWAIWRTPGTAVPLLAFGVLGMLGVQYTYFAVIEASNAATGTVLQYLGPTVIVVFLAIRQRRWPHRVELLALVLALVGTLLLVTHGDLSVLHISPRAWFWGLSSACALASLPPAFLSALTSPQRGDLTILGSSMACRLAAMSPASFTTGSAARLRLVTT